MLVEPDEPREPAEPALRQAFGLAPVAAQIALGLARGQDLREIAEKRAASLGTVRMQIKSIFQKTETHRQAKLVALLNHFTQAPGASRGTEPLCESGHRPAALLGRLRSRFCEGQARRRGMSRVVRTKFMRRIPFGNIATSWDLHILERTFRTNKMDTSKNPVTPHLGFNHSRELAPAEIPVLEVVRGVQMEVKTLRMSIIAALLAASCGQALAEFGDEDGIRLFP